MGQAIGIEQMLEEKRRFQSGGGVSENNHAQGFVPAFMDTATGIIYLSVDTDGSLAVCHLYDGLPDSLVTERDAVGRVVAVRETVVAGFERGGCFFTREQAARLVEAS